MEQTQVLSRIKQVASQVLPKGSSLYLYGSRARGDAHEDSDWDLLSSKENLISLSDLLIFRDIYLYLHRETDNYNHVYNKHNC